MQIPIRHKFKRITLKKIVITMIILTTTLLVPDSKGNDLYKKKVCKKNILNDTCSRIIIKNLPPLELIPYKRIDGPIELKVLTYEKYCKKKNCYRNNKSNRNIKYRNKYKRNYKMNSYLENDWEDYLY